MILFRDYDEKEKIDRAWYNSSTIVYSECEDKENALKTLKVVFKGGSTYYYYDVPVQDYLMFMHGGLDGSNGKALNQYIKPKCRYEKTDNTNLEYLKEQLEYLQKEQEKSKIN